MIFGEVFLGVVLGRALGPPLIRLLGLAIIVLVILWVTR